jgi:hypothetical protein
MKRGGLKYRISVVIRVIEKILIVLRRHNITGVVLTTPLFDTCRNVSYLKESSNASYFMKLNELTLKQTGDIILNVLGSKINNQK